MILYVGYVIFDYSTPIYMGTNEEEIRKKTKEFAERRPWFVESYNIKKNKIYQFECD